MDEEACIFGARMHEKKRQGFDRLNTKQKLFKTWTLDKYVLQMTA